MLYFGGSKRLEATITALTNSTKVRLDRADGLSLIYDGHTVYQSPASAEYGGARFDIFTWQYFFMAPFKFSDPGANWEYLGDKQLQGKSYEAAKLTFEAGTGDAPDDWYIAYKHPDTHRLFSMAYIVTFNKSREKAEEEPHAITYHDYEEVDGVPFATRWQFWMWTEARGIFDQLGRAEIANVRFLDPDPIFFTVGEDAKEVPL